MNQERNDSNKKSLWITMLVQIVLVCALYLITAWKEPFPPIPEYGIELSMFDDSGSASAATQLDEEITEPQQNQPTEETEETVEEQTEQVEEVLEDPVEEPVEEEIQEAEKTEETPVADNAEEVIKEVPKEPIPDETPKKADDSSKQEKTPIEEVPKTNSPSETKESAADSTSNQVSTGPVIDERALYGQGKDDGEGSVQLQLAGFQLYQQPEINDTSSESGKISYRITVDEEGYIIGTDLLESTVTPATELIYRRAVQKLFLEKTTTNAPPRSTGTITFIIKSN